MPILVTPTSAEDLYEMNSVEDQMYIHAHSNGIAVQGLDSTHPALAENKTIVSIDWQHGKFDLSKTAPRGKRKKGTQFIQAGQVLCTLKCADETEIKIRSVINGKLLEVNSQLEKNPQLCVSDATRRGYLVVMMLSKKTKDDKKSVRNADENQNEAKPPGHLFPQSSTSSSNVVTADIEVKTATR